MAHETEDVDLREEWCELGRDATWHNLNSCFSKERAMFGKSKALPRSTHVISGKTETNLFFFFFFLQLACEWQVEICFLASGGLELLVPVPEGGVLNIQDFGRQVNRGSWKCARVRVCTKVTNQPSFFFFPKSQFTSTPLPSSLWGSFTVRADAMFQMRNNPSLQCFSTVAISNPPSADCPGAAS